MKPRNSHFCTLIIQLFLLAKLNSSVSFRSLSKILAMYKLPLELQCKTPSYQTGLLLVKKIGYHQLHLPQKKADDWIVITDESVSIGQERLLVILGIRRSEIDFTRPLKLQDLKPLLVKSKETWTGDDVAEQLKIVEEKVGKILYGVTDSGGAFKKGFREAGIKQVFDITHSIANALEKIYKENPDFKDFTHRMAEMRGKSFCGKFAHLIPPNQRSKSRFLNIDIIADWGMKVLTALEKNNASIEEKQQLLWVKKYQNLIEEMNKLIDIIKQISIQLKTYGLSKKTKRKCISILKECKTGKMIIFRDHMMIYLESNIKNIQKRSEKLLCCTDIIESTFGRYKNEINKNPMSGITDLALIIPALTSNLSTETINKAIDSCSVKQIKQWNKANLCLPLSVKRYAIFSIKENEENLSKMVI